MAGETIFGSAFENIIDVTRLAGNRGVVSIQRKGCLAMIEGNLPPLRGFVARAAILPELTGVRILCGVTRETILRGAFENIVDMAGLAIDGEM
jgi:hypothetical protein